MKRKMHEELKKINHHVVGVIHVGRGGFECAQGLQAELTDRLGYGKHDRCRAIEETQIHHLKIETR